ncbi:uncharacterized protein TEOVI_000831500 [Trypanosoma equiperdum]|uniref:Uncharacterized protein n=1 Tax=Trypanosoma equiperdum TaxID=5694 RepID=A0A1G4I2F4_TRYEQ|nr:hypothetical protein TEOVI_000831500 [Trypanosoma equiperdum]
MLTATNFLGVHTATGTATPAAETTITGATDGSCTTTFKPSAPGDSSCETETAGDAQAIDSAPKHLDEFKTLNLLHDDVFAPQVLKIQALCKGTVNADPSGTRSDTACGDTTTQGQWSNAVGVRTVKPTITSAKIDDNVRYTATETDTTCAKTKGRSRR